jgi:hypothetical protein
MDLGVRPRDDLTRSAEDPPAAFNFATERQADGSIKVTRVPLPEMPANRSRSSRSKNNEPGHLVTG